MIKSGSENDQAEQQKKVQIKVSEDTKYRNKQDPLIDLCQIDNEEVSPLDKEVLLLITRLLENVEEFYELREKIRHIMVEDQLTETKIMGLFQTLVQGLKAEKSFLEKNKLGPTRNFL